MPLDYKNAVTQKEYEIYFNRRIPLWLRGLVFDKAAKIFFRILKNVKYDKDLLIMPYLELCITPLCNLRCKKCANFMPLYSNASNYKIENILPPFDKVMSSIDSVIWFRILGGEPFLHPNLDDIVRHCSKNKKIDHVEIVTNGTILPSDNTINMLQETKSIVYISNYDYASIRRDSLMNKLQKYNISYICEENLEWEDMGNGQRFNYSIQQVKNVYMACTDICKTLIQWELHICPRSAHGTALGIIKKKEGNYIDIMKGDSLALRSAIRALYNLESIEACYHCTEPKRNMIIAGEQIIQGNS